MDKELKNPDSDALSQSTAGVWYGIAAFSLWGLLPLYWKMLKQVPAFEIFCHRIIWSFVFVSVIVTLQKRWSGLKKAFDSPKTGIAVLMSAIFIGMNWFTYIWAVNHDHIVESSMGYYINPLLSVVLGVCILRERLNFWQIMAIILALAGVVIITAQYGAIPWVSLLLAATFALYGLFKKIANLESIISLTLETTILAPLAFGYLMISQTAGRGAFGSTPLVTLLLICSGIVTAIPLLCFAKAANRVSLSTIGFTQYISPTLSLFLGIAVFRESFSFVHMISFGFIWIALLLYTISQANFMQNFQPKIFKSQNS